MRSPRRGAAAVGAATSACLVSPCLVNLFVELSSDALACDDSAIHRTTSSRTGIRFVPVEHDGNRTASDEEIAEIVKLIAELRQGTFTDSDGSTRSLRDDDFMVVTPYNAKMRRFITPS